MLDWKGEVDANVCVNNNNKTLSRRRRQKASMVTKIRAKPDEPTIGTLLLSLICLAINVHNVQYLGICRLMKDNRHYA